MSRSRKKPIVKDSDARSTADWTLSDEYEFLRSAKMNALGISDAFLTGEASFSSMEKLLQVFVEKLRAVRAEWAEKAIRK